MERPGSHTKIRRERLPQRFLRNHQDQSGSATAERQQRPTHIRKTPPGIGLLHLAGNTPHHRPPLQHKIGELSQR
jgi:hypothetical protein